MEVKNPFRVKKDDNLVTVMGKSTAESYVVGISTLGGLALAAWSVRKVRSMWNSRKKKKKEEVQEPEVLRVVKAVKTGSVR